MVILIAFVAISVGIVSADIQVIPASKSRVYSRSSRLTATDAVTEYGRSVAIDGDLVAVGAGGDGAVGAVYLYKRQGMRISRGKTGFPRCNRRRNARIWKNCRNSGQYGVRWSPLCTS